MWNNFPICTDARAFLHYTGGFMHGMQCILYKILLYMNILGTRVPASVVVSAWYGTVHPVAALGQSWLWVFVYLQKRAHFAFAFLRFVYNFWCTRYRIWPFLYPAFGWIHYRMYRRSLDTRKGWIYNRFFFICLQNFASKKTSMLFDWYLLSRRV